MITDAFDQIFGDKTRVMIVMAHPDDSEIYAGGTIARLIKQNKDVLIVTVTNGNKGSRDEICTAQDLAKKREEEANKAMAIFGLPKEHNVYLAFNDGCVTNDLSVIERLAFFIRSFKPDLLLSHNPQDQILHLPNGECMVNHRDHRNTSIAAIDAAYPYSRDLLFFPEHFEQAGVTSHAVKQFLFSDYYTPTAIHFDVSDFIETKFQAIKSHQSQITEEIAEKYLSQFTKNEGSKWFETFHFTVLTH